MCFLLPAYTLLRDKIRRDRDIESKHTTRKMLYLLQSLTHSSHILPIRKLAQHNNLLAVHSVAETRSSSLEMNGVAQSGNITISLPSISKRDSQADDSTRCFGTKSRSSGNIPFPSSHQEGLLSHSESTSGQDEYGKRSSEINSQSFKVRRDSRDNPSSSSTAKPLAKNIAACRPSQHGYSLYRPEPEAELHIDARSSMRNTIDLRMSGLEGTSFMPTHTQAIARRLFLGWDLRQIQWKR